MEHTCNTPNYTDGPCQACAEEMSEDRVQLLACPFCGGEAVLDCLIDEDDYFVHCKDCEVQQIANYQKSEAVIRWNTRGGQRVLTALDIERIGKKAAAANAVKRGGYQRF